MTALSDYARLEAQGVWRAATDAQRCDVIVSMGEASLTLFDRTETALTHWSLAAIERRNPGKHPAIYSPAPASGEELEVADDAMIDALERVRASLRRRHPRRGRLRLAATGTLLAGAVALAVFWLPDALVRHTASVVPAAARAAIGARLLSEVERLTGAACVSSQGERALNNLSERLFGAGAPRLVVLPGGIGETAHVPGGTILVHRELVELHDSPEPVAGYLLAEQMRASTGDPLLRFLRDAGAIAAFRLLVSGKLPEGNYRAQAETLVRTRPAPVDPDALIAWFDAAELSTRPYARARDVTGETVLRLIEADPYPDGTPEPILGDGDWLRLQAICGE